jgi:hypothetical protein
MFFVLELILTNCNSIVRTTYGRTNTNTIIVFSFKMSHTNSSTGNINNNDSTSLGRPKYCSVTFVKSEFDHVGIRLRRSAQGHMRIVSLSGVLLHSPISIGDQVVAIRSQKLGYIEPVQVARLRRLAGRVTIVTVCPNGDPRLAEAMVEHPTAAGATWSGPLGGLEIQPNALGRSGISFLPYDSIWQNSVLQKDDIVLEVNGMPCRDGTTQLDGYIDDVAPRYVTVLVARHNSRAGQDEFEDFAKAETTVICRQLEPAERYRPGLSGRSKYSDFRAVKPRGYMV